uniref:Uncharacterized protein n=1 Tax=Anguilla anguilla TaxID=7936 RepID=A0A0E9PZ17_ANGAN
MPYHRPFDILVFLNVQMYTIGTQLYVDRLYHTILSLLADPC